MSSLIERAQGPFSLYLLPSVISAAASFLMLPLVTAVVGPPEYGLFALVTAYTAFGSALATLGGNYIISHRFLGATHHEQRRVASTVALLSLLTITLYGLVLFAAWRFLPGMHLVTLGGMSLAIAAMVVNQPWIGALDIVTVRGDARIFAGVAISQTFVSSAVLLYGLYEMKLGLTAFFLSQLAGAIVALGGAYRTFRGIFEFRISLDIVRELRSLGLIAALGSVAETIQNGVERTAIAAHTGVAQLGIYTNSQSYRTFAAVPVGAISKSTWPVTLAEAGETDNRFPRTKVAWDVGYIGLTAAGLFFATLGDYVIAALTHDKFTPAYVFAMFWMMFLLLQNSGKPQTGLLFRHGRGRTYASILIVSAFIGMLAMVALVPVLGLWGAAMAVAVQQLFLRGSIQIAARRIRPVPFQDGWVLFGLSYIPAVYTVRVFADTSVAGNAIIFAAASLLLLVISGPTLFRRNRQGVLMNSTPAAHHGGGAGHRGHV